MTSHLIPGSSNYAKILPFKLVLWMKRQKFCTVGRSMYIRLVSCLHPPGKRTNTPWDPPWTDRPPRLKPWTSTRCLLGRSDFDVGESTGGCDPHSPGAAATLRRRRKKRRAARAVGLGAAESAFCGGGSYNAWGIPLR